MSLDGFPPSRHPIFFLPLHFRHPTKLPTKGLRRLKPQLQKVSCAGHAVISSSPHTLTMVYGNFLAKPYTFDSRMSDVEAQSPFRSVRPLPSMNGKRHTLIMEGKLPKMMRNQV